MNAVCNQIYISIEVKHKMIKLTNDNEDNFWDKSRRLNKNGEKY